ncbi:hypothetical protein Q4Q35_00785 [Flavivirga aquimarina]|uniref:AttH domain-containing protein n=1 Tax=Flavivirga aquimarina TaxID=2027862 RepID=A0ABT8W5E3_9FLAO|nr:hypothetical protein [Flavivirga aquimarina]MDO5968330.1 hypothetical protein [Flavivirga aquimarina]
MNNKIIFHLLFCSICFFHIGCSSENEITENPEINTSEEEITTQITAKNSALTANTWTGSINLYQNDIWFVLFDNGVATYDFRIGTTGVISEMRDRTESFKALLSPSFNNEQTDRVVQWTIWSLDLIRNLNYTGPSFEQRFNVTQGGTFTNQLHQTLDVEINTANNQLDVYGKADLQWKLDNQSVMTGNHTALTHYSYDSRGFLKVYRVVSVGQPKLNGVVNQWNDLYFEGWTPMKGDDDVFTGLALGMDSQGTPSWWYLRNQNIPTYPFLSVSNTNGYAVVFNNQNRTGKDAVGIVYGTNNVISSNTNASYVLNTLEWDTGIGVFPAILANGNLPAYSLVEQTMYIVPRSGLSADMSSLLTTLSSEIPAPRIYKPSEIPSGSELETIYSTLQANESISGTRTDHIRPLISNN